MQTDRMTDGIKMAENGSEADIGSLENLTTDAINLEIEEVGRKNKFDKIPELIQY